MEPHKGQTVFAGGFEMKESHAQNWLLAHLGGIIYTLLDELWVGVIRGL